MVRHKAWVASLPVQADHGDADSAGLIHLHVARCLSVLIGTAMQRMSCLSICLTRCQLQNEETE